MIRICFLEWVSQRIHIVWGNKIILDIWCLPVFAAHLYLNSDIKYMNIQR